AGRRLRGPNPDGILPFSPRFTGSAGKLQVEELPRPRRTDEPKEQSLLRRNLDRESQKGAAPPLILDESGNVDEVLAVERVLVPAGHGSLLLQPLPEESRDEREVACPLPFRDCLWHTRERNGLAARFSL